MTRETVAVKAARYLAEGRLVVTKIDGDSVTAVCRGSEVYLLGHDVARGGWWCSCPVRRTDPCSHLLALQTVTITIRRTGQCP